MYFCLGKETVYSSRSDENILCLNRSINNVVTELACYIFCLPVLQMVTPIVILKCFQFVGGQKL